MGEDGRSMPVIVIFTPSSDMTHPIFSTLQALTALILLRIPMVGGVEPRILYMDGDHTWDACLPGLKRTVTGDSGLLISHTAYGQLPYNASKNCFLTLAAPLGYRLRVRALDFAVGSENNEGGEEQKSCERDTLHVFDHEQRPLDPRRMDELSMEERAPGRILGEFCHHLQQATAGSSHGGSRFPQQRSPIMAESTHNALTLWWHSDGNVSHRRGAHSRSEAEGYRLLWSSFRVRGAEEKCRDGAEFTCAAPECIPLSLGCNSHPDCRDGSDLDRTRQLKHHCEHIPTDFLSQLSGVKRLLICLAIVLLLGSLFLCCCASLYTVRRRSKEKGGGGGDTGRFDNTSNDALKCGGALLPTSIVDESGNIQSTKGSSQPLPPNFSPPQVPANRQRQVQLNAMERQPTPRGAAIIALRPSYQTAPLAAEQSGGSTSTSTSTPAINKTAAVLHGVAGTNLPRTSHLTQQLAGHNNKNIDQRHLLL